MKTYTLTYTQQLPITIEQAWEFFSNPQNLLKITPPEMKFELLTDLSSQPIVEGLLINYTVRPLLNIPLGWTTKITHVNAPHSFSDIQLKGPYKLWNHTHTFVTTPKGVLMTDTIEYALHLGILGQLGNTLFVRKKVQGIFNYRETALKQIFNF